jgi:hypothetical protein
MYAIGHVIYGIPLTKEIEKVCNKVLNVEAGEHDGGFFKTFYSGSGDTTPGFCGVELASFDESSNFLLSKITKTPTKAEKAKAIAKIAALPKEIKRIMPPIGAWVVWSTS